VLAVQSIGQKWVWPCAMLLPLIWGCASATEDSSSLNCSKLSKTFFTKPTTEQMAEFSSLDIENQYAIFICGNQVREPPSIHLATPFAKEGQSVVGFLKEKLTAATGDLTIRDILLVFSDMSRYKSYNVAADTDLMKVITAAVARVKDPFWKKTSEQSLDEIRQQAPAAAQ
jgi:hypothetical protein